MPEFTYKAKQGPHQTVEGTVTAASRDAAVSHVLRLGLTPLEVALAQTRKSGAKQSHKTPASHCRFASAATVFLIRQLSDMISAGVPVLQALTLSARQVRQPRLRVALEGMERFVRDGGTLSEAMARAPQIFPRLYSPLVRAGETSGRLSEVLTRLADLAQRDLDTRGQVASALVYPALILVVAFGTVAALLTWVVPRLAAIFADLNEALPLPTVILLNLSAFVSRFWWLIALVILCALLVLRRVSAVPAGRLWIDTRLLRLPLAGPLMLSTETGRFARIMSVLLGNGVPVVTALESAALVMGNAAARRAVEDMAAQVKDGASLSLALRRSALFPETVVTMAAVGEAAGRAPQGLERMADYFEELTRRRVKTITTLLEPAMILGLGVMVGGVVLAMLMPLMRMNMIIR